MPSLRRALAEIGIIVLGVLLALSGEALFQRVAERTDLMDYRSSLRADLQRDSASLAALLEPDFMPAQMAAVDSLLHYIAEPTSNPPGERVLEYLINAAYIPGVERTRATFDEMVSAGELDLIEIGDFRRALVAYYARPMVPSLESYGIVYHAPYFMELGRALGVGRYYQMLECVDLVETRTECHRRFVRGDELEVLRTSGLGPLLLGLQLLRYYVTIPARDLQDDVNELLRDLAGTPAP